MPRATVEAARNISGAARVSNLISSDRNGFWITASTSSRSIRLLEGLAKAPDNVSLLLRKALVQLHLNQAEPAARDPAALAPEATRDIWVARS